MTELLDQYCPSWLREAAIESADPLAGSELDFTVYQSDWDAPRIAATANYSDTKWVTRITFPELELAIDAAEGLAGDVTIGSESVPVQVADDQVQILIGPFNVSGTAEEWRKILERERADSRPLSQCPTMEPSSWTEDHFQFLVISID